MATVGEWVEGARPRTLPAAIAPVAVGSGLAGYAHSFSAGRALLALAVAVALQVGVNYANDYSDGVRGTDAKRIGPVRLVGQGLASPRAVKLAAYASFLVALIAGLVLVVLTEQWWLLLVGVASVAAAWLYTGGPKPYGYLGLGELFVLIFFGIVPVVGTAYVQTLTIDAAFVVAGVAVGALSCAILVANNLRDIPTDAATGKRTLAVRLGDRRTRWLYFWLVVAAGVLTVVLAYLTTPRVFGAVALLAIAVLPLKALRAGAVGPALISVLKQTGLLLLVYGVGLGILLAL